ncbi:MAG TPA: glycosyltransferase [Gemmatimonadales bacterium]|nr:glycosyltransferase [Gemmatimonadales bacterium]
MTLPPAQAARWRGARFAHLIESDGPGGAERMLASVAAELQSAGSYNVVIVPAAGEGWIARELRGTGVQVEPFRLDRPFSPQFASWLAGVFRKHRIMLAHSHEFSMAVYGAWAAWLAGRTPHLFTMHGGRYYAERLRRRVALRAACLCSSAVVSVSRSLARFLAHDLWIRPSRISTIPNGVRPPVATQSSLRAELGLATTDQLVVAVGNLYPVKGHRYLLEALALLAPRHPGLHVAVAGRGALEEPLRARARDLHVADRFHLLGLRSDIANVLAGADAFVLPSLSEGVPLALLEAMLAGRPVIATSVGEVPIVLDGGRAGLLVPAQDAPALATAVASLLSDPALARRISAAAHDRATERYTLDAMMEGYLTLYARALRNHAYDARPEGVREDERQALPHDRPPGERALVR